MKNLGFRKAKPGEIETVLSLLRDAASWMKGRGIDHWREWLDPPEIFVKWIREGFDRGQFYMVQGDGRTIGCVRMQSRDPFWGEGEDSAGYIHSFTIDRDLAGRGIGVEVLNLIQDYFREHGKKFFRLDCGTEVKGLRAYYERFGFKPVGEVTVKGERLTLYEKPI